ncbi:MAG: glycosyltransferase family 4 protein [Sporomusaceae bacterium]|nr:glycosyltransferase family 4 protein [Sporomusaceae bacterium]
MSKILFVMPQLCFPPSDGGKQGLFHRILEISKKMDSYTFFINAASVSNYAKEPTFQHFKKFASDVKVIDRYNASIRFDASFREKIKQVVKWLFSGKPRFAQIYQSACVRQNVTDYVKLHNIKIICIEFPYMFELIDLRMLKKMGCKVICVMHNIEHLYFRESKSLPGFLNRINLLTRYEEKRLKRYEYSVFRKMDLVIGVADSDVEFIKQETGLSNVIYQPTLLPPAETMWTNNQSSRYIVFPGSLSFYPNYQGIMWFLKEVFALYTKKHPDIVLKITGNVSDSVRAEISQFDNVELTGFLTKSQLDSLLVNCMFVVIPIFRGAGVKIKLIESMSYGLPIITTPRGAQGVPYGECEPFYIARDGHEFMGQMHTLTTDQSLRYSMGEKAKQFFYENYYMENMVTKWIDCFEKINF